MDRKNKIAQSFSPFSHFSHSFPCLFPAFSLPYSAFVSLKSAFLSSYSSFSGRFHLTAVMKCLRRAGPEEQHSSVSCPSLRCSVATPDCAGATSQQANKTRQGKGKILVAPCARPHGFETTAGLSLPSSPSLIQNKSWFKRIIQLLIQPFNY